MKLFTFGCSFTKDNYQKTWADITAEHLDVELINRAERGSGANYLVQRLLSSDDIDPSRDLVLIMWPSSDRYDLWADGTTPHLLQDIDTCSWPDGISPKFVDHTGANRTDSGFILNGSVPRGYKNQYYKYFYSPTQSINDWYSMVVLAQLYLTKRSIRYFMSAAFPLNNPIHYHHGNYTVNRFLFDQIDQTKFVNESSQQGFFDY
jgi:hypothetical protein